MKVMKFGGGCLKDAEHFFRVAKIIKSEKQNSIVIVSAVFGITNIMENGIQKSIESEKNIPGIIQTVRLKHREIAEACIQNKDIREKTKSDIELRIKKLERLLYGVTYTEEITESLKAHILSYGERLAALLLSGVLKSIHRKAAALEANQIGLATDESFENATAVLAEVKKNLNSSVLPLVNKGIVPVITGFFGCNSEGQVTTFGRNGSDYSAAVIAYGMGTDSLEIWKDIDGFMSADPKIIKDSHQIDKLSYYEAAELSYFGAKVLHPRTMEPLSDIHIPIYIRNLWKIEKEATKIFPSGCETEEVVKSVTFNRDISVLKIHGSGVGYKPGVIAEIGRILSDKGINIFSIITSQTCINLLIDVKDSCKSSKFIKRLEGGVIEKVDLVDDIALVAVVGEGLSERKGIAARVFSSVAKENINVKMISSGASEVAYYFLVDKTEVESAIKAIHKEFF